MNATHGRALKDADSQVLQDVWCHKVHAQRRAEPLLRYGWSMPSFKSRDHGLGIDSRGLGHNDIKTTADPLLRCMNAAVSL
jgi:hypothetical protein